MDFATAVDFMIALERREIAAGAVIQDLSTIDSQLRDVNEVNSDLGRDGYSFPTGRVTTQSTAWASDEFIKRMLHTPMGIIAGVGPFRYGQSDIRTVGDLRFRPVRGIKLKVYGKAYIL